MSVLVSLFLFKESSVCPSGHFACTEMAQPTSGKVGVCPVKREIHLASMYGSEMVQERFANGLSS